jgi:hypothetical protein
MNIESDMNIFWCSFKGTHGTSGVCGIADENNPADMPRFQLWAIVQTILQDELFSHRASCINLLPW